MRLNKSCKKADLGMAAVGDLRALFLDLRGRIKLLLFKHPDAAFVFFLFFSVDLNGKRRNKAKEIQMVEGSGWGEILNWEGRIKESEQEYKNYIINSEKRKKKEEPDKGESC